MNSSFDKPLTVAQAKRLEYSIIGISVFALFCIFQPFSKLLFTAGCIGVVFGGLVFNLMPVCVAGSSYRKIAKTALTVAIIFIIVVILALGSAWLYGVYIRNGG